MNHRLTRIVAAALTAGWSTAANADPGQWQYTVNLYAMGAYRADNGTWSLTMDATYMALGGGADSRGDRLRGKVDIDQITLMGTVGRRLTPSLEALFSLGYFDLSADLAVRLRNPSTGAAIERTAGTDANWVDPLAGLHYQVPFAGDWRFSLRGDVGGFSVGSDLTYHALANIRWQMNERFGLGFGYRLLAFDYEDGKRGTRGYQRFDLTEQGPLVGLTISFYRGAGRRLRSARPGAA